MAHRLGKTSERTREKGRGGGRRNEGEEGIRRSGKTGKGVWSTLRKMERSHCESKEWALWAIQGICGEHARVASE